MMSTQPNEARHGALECGDLSPSNVVARTVLEKRFVQVLLRTALRGAAWLTSQPSEQSGDKSPHSKAGDAPPRRFDRRCPFFHLPSSIFLP